MSSFLTNRKVKSLEKKINALRQTRLAQEVADSEIAKEIALYHDLAEVYEKLRFDKEHPYAHFLVLESYRSAATLGDVKALYRLASQLIERGKFWQSLGDSHFACKTHEKYIHDTFEEAFVYLQAAEDKDDFKAKRLHGLVYINGWGVDIDLDKGFALVIESIQQEGSWDRATEIFQELNLNKPEFFSYIMAPKN